MKISELQSYLRKNKLDGCILHAEDPNFKYYLQKYLMDGLLFIPKTGKPTVFVHRLEDLTHNFNVVKLMEKDTLKKFFKKKKTKVAGYNPSYASAKLASSLKKMFKLRDVEEKLENLRIIKTQKEINYLKKAAAIADKILKKLINNFNFKTEGEIKRFLKTEMVKQGVVESFEPIVASGIGAATPHYFGDKKLAKGFLIIDMGVKVNGYCSDITRTFFIGKPKQSDLDIYNKVLKVQKECIKMCRKGTSCSKPFDYALKELGEEFCHGLGHGIGLKIHELPNLKPNGKEKFQNNMVFTVEPGWYSVKKKIGIRIEDDIIIKAGKPIVITKTTKKLICF